GFSAGFLKGWISHARNVAVYMAFLSAYTLQPPCLFPSLCELMSNKLDSAVYAEPRRVALRPPRHFRGTPCPNRDTLRQNRRNLLGGPSVAAGPGGRRLEAARALVAEEVVPREDVVHLQALGAGVPLADVALEEGLVVDHGLAPAVTQEALRSGPATGLAGSVIHHEGSRRGGRPQPPAGGGRCHSIAPRTPPPGEAE